MGFSAARLRTGVGFRSGSADVLGLAPTFAARLGSTLGSALGLALGLVLVPAGLAHAGPVVPSRAGGSGEGIARYAAGRVVQEREFLSFAFPTRSIDYQRAELDNPPELPDGMAGAAGMARARPFGGALAMSTGTRVSTVNFQHLGDASAEAHYDDTFDVVSSTLPSGTVITLQFKHVVSTLDSTNHTADSGSLGDNNAANSGNTSVRIRTDAPSDNDYLATSTLSRVRDGAALLTGVLDQGPDYDPNADSYTGEETVSIQAVVGSTLTLEMLLVGEGTSRARFVHEGNTGFCASLVWGFELPEGVDLVSRLDPDAPIPSLEHATRERAVLEIPPGPFVIPAPATLVPLALGAFSARRRRA